MRDEESTKTQVNAVYCVFDMSHSQRWIAAFFMLGYLRQKPPTSLEPGRMRETLCRDEKKNRLSVSVSFLCCSFWGGDILEMWGRPKMGSNEKKEAPPLCTYPQSMHRWNTSCSSWWAFHSYSSSCGWCLGLSLIEWEQGNLLESLHHLDHTTPDHLQKSPWSNARMIKMPFVCDWSTKWLRKWQTCGPVMDICSFPWWVRTKNDSRPCLKSLFEPKEKNKIETYSTDRHLAKTCDLQGWIHHWRPTHTPAHQTHAGSWQPWVYQGRWDLWSLEYWAVDFVWLGEEAGDELRLCADIGADL